MAGVLRYIADKAVGLLRKALGFREYGNNGNPYSEWQYGVEYPNGGWCCSFWSWIAYMAGFRFGNDAQYGDKGFASTNVAEPWARKHGLWRDRSWRAQQGDAAIFNWDGGGTDHVEVVVYDDGVQIVTIGGNTGNAVASRTRDRTYVAGFVALSQSPQAQPVLDAAALAFFARAAKWQKDVTVAPLELGDTNGNVTFLNQLLAARGLLASTKYMNTFTKATRDAVVHEKQLRPEITNKTGKKVGGDFAKAILTPRA